MFKRSTQNLSRPCAMSGPGRASAAPGARDDVGGVGLALLPPAAGILAAGLSSMIWVSQWSLAGLPPR
jgi:hypothetical protein